MSAQTSKKRVLIAGIWHETHTLMTGVTPLSDFKIVRGEEMLRALGDASTLAGTLQAGHEQGWEMLPVVEMSATPSALVADEVVETFWSALREAAEREQANGLDGINLNMHGAMVSESHDDVEGEILERLRRLPGFETISICGALDLHGTFTERMARYSSGHICYRKNPHTDAKQTAVDAALLLDRLMRTGDGTQTVYAHPPIVWPPSGTGTANEPMRTLEAKAREIETTYPEILAVNVFGGFSFSDIPDAGVSFSAVTTGDPARAQALLDELSAIAWERREEGNRIGIPLEEAFSRMAQLPPGAGPVLLVESSDNIGGGAPGDLTVILRALIAHDIANSAVCLNDPEAVQILQTVPTGARRTLPIGGKSGQIGAEPIVLEVEVVSRSDGRFTLEDAHSHAAVSGLHHEMGPCVVVRHRGVTILLTSRKTPPFDLAQWRSQGIDPEALSVIGVKAAVAHRQAYDPIARASFTVDTPGPCAENLQRLPYRHIRRPIFPLDAREGEHRS